MNLNGWKWLCIWFPMIGSVEERKKQRQRKENLWNLERSGGGGSWVWLREMKNVKTNLEKSYKLISKWNFQNQDDAFGPNFKSSNSFSNNSWHENDPTNVQIMT